MTVQNSTVAGGHPIEGDVLFASRHPFFKTRPRLGTLRGIRRELAALYLATKAGALDPGDAAKMTFILRETARTLIDGEIDDRVKALEAADGLPDNDEGADGHANY